MNPNKLNNCKLRPSAAPNKSFLLIPFYGTPCIKSSHTGLNSMWKLKISTSLLSSLSYLRVHRVTSI